MVLSLRREGLAWMSGEVLHRENGEVLEQTVQRGCGCPIPGDMPVAGGLELDDLWCPLQPKLFYNFVNILKTEAF